MRTLGIFAIAACLVGVSAVACSSGDDEPAKLEADVCSKSKSSNSDKSDCPSKSSNPTDPTPTPEPTPAPPPPPLPARDGGPDAAPVPPPQPGSTYCKDLNSCCGKISNTIEKFSCIGVAVAGKETPCQVELALCLGGGITGGGNDCADLNTCCNQMDNEGYPSDAQDCRGHANTNDNNTCKSWLSSYRNANWCN